MATDPNLRKAAQDERDSLKKIISGAVFATGGAGIVATALAIPPLALIGIVPGVIAWRTHNELTSQERLVEDPPRFDFESETEPRFDRLYEANFNIDGLPNELLFDYCQASVELAAFRDAMVTATERAMGAEERSEEVFVEARREEAQRLALNTVDALERTAAVLDEIGELLRTERFLEADQRVSGWDIDLPADPLSALPDELAGPLFRIGAQADVFAEWPDDELSRHAVTGLVFSDLSDAIEGNVQSKRRLARALPEAMGAGPAMPV